MPKSDTKSFTVTVTADPLGVLSASSNESVTLTWDSVAGQSYKVQSTEGDSGVWVDGETVVATGTSTSVAVSNGASRSYRVVEAGGSSE